MKIVKFSFLSAFLLLLTVLANTGCKEDDDPRFLDTPEILWENFVTEKATHTHKKGVDPCPQPFQAPAGVTCYRNGSVSDSCVADSAVIIQNNPGYTCTFEDGSVGLHLDNSVIGYPFKMEFTCAIAVSFVDTFQVKLYYQNQEVGTEPVVVEVTVVEQ